MTSYRRHPRTIAASVQLTLSLACQAALWSVAVLDAGAAELFVGAATTRITPKEPVALIGSFSLRVAKTVESPITASVLVLESREGEKVLDQAIIVSSDLCVIRGGLGEMLREEVKSRIADFDARKLILTATHSHTAPVTSDKNYPVPKDVMQPAEYRRFFCDRVTDAVVKAWEERKPGGVSWGLGHAVVAQNRRAVYADGTAKMYGKTDRPDFRGIEGYEDHGVGVLFFWDARKSLIAMAVDVACPAQEVAGHRAVNADFWHETRELLQKKYGKDLCVLCWCGAAGDQSPRLLYNRAAEERMRKLRGLTRLEEIARRIGRAVDEVYEIAKDDIRTYLPTARAIKGGGYGTTVQSNRVGPKGGQVLVNKTVEAINSLWE
jgi:hypothetical protein